MSELLCHETGRMFPHRAGADLFETPESATSYIKRYGATQEALKTLGFVPVLDSNAWEKDGVRITVHQILQEGLDHVLEKHAEAVRSLAAGGPSL